MPCYSAVHQTAAGTALPIINITGGTTLRIKLYEVIIGCDATPADLAGEFNVSRTTDAGTGGTALTEVAIDPLAVAATGAAVGGTFGVVPTIEANSAMLNIGLHQKATFRWVAASESARLFSKLTSANGLELSCIGHGGTPNINATMHWEE